MEELIILINGKEHNVMVEEIENGKLRVHFDGKSYDVKTKSDMGEEILKGIETKKTKPGANSITAPLPGTIVSLHVAVGENVTEGKSLMKLVAMKMENDIIALKDGIIKEIMVKKGQNVNKGDVLAIIE